ncbi:MAG: hypothetical protein EOO39_40170, partial [Cytophagaceae bacterium]
SSLVATAQVGIGTTTPQAALDVTATDMGMLVPRVALADTQTVAPVTNPEGGTLVNGTLIYNTATAGGAPNNVTPGFYYWQNSGWVAVKDGATLDAAYDGTGSGAGRTITADAGPVEVNGQGGFLVSGSYDGNSQIALSQDEGSHLLFDPGKSAFRAGYVDNSSWSAENVGQFSSAIGYNPVASGSYSMALGNNVTASGSYSLAAGDNATASGENSVAIGYAVVASGIGATATGISTTASGTASTAGGGNNQALALYSTALGRGNTARSLCEFVIGQYNTNYGAFSASSWYGNDRLFVIGNGQHLESRSDALIVYKNGNLFAAGNLTLNGTTASKAGGGAWTATSDSRLKKEVKQFKDGLAQVLGINPVKYHYNELSGYDTSKEFVGVIAQELQKVAPYMVGNFTKDGAEYLNV